MKRGLLLALALLFARGAAAEQGRPPQEPPTPPNLVEQMNRARATFEYGDYAQASRLLSALVEGGRFESPTLRADAYRMLGLSLFYQGRKGEAYTAFLELLYLDPDFELDPFYVPPAAVSFFETVRKENEARLAPLRAQKRSELEARRKAAEAETERRRKQEQDEERRRLSLTLQPSIERRVVQKEFWVSLMPFGVGQFQNGDRSLGIALATSQVIAGAASAGSALLIEELRDPASGKFDNRGPYQLASRLNVVKWVGAGLFYALWAAGAVHAAIRFQPEQQLPDRLLRRADAPPAAPSPGTAGSP